MIANDRAKKGDESLYSHQEGIFFLWDLVGDDYKDKVGSQVSWEVGNVHGWREPSWQGIPVVGDGREWWDKATTIILRKNQSTWGKGVWVADIIREAELRSRPNDPIPYREQHYGYGEDMHIQSIWKGRYDEDGKIESIEQIWPSPYGIINQKHF